MNCDLLIVDEASMIDVILMHHLMKAIPPQATFILVGENARIRLPSGGAGECARGHHRSRGQSRLWN
ncbi:MAG: AAA family ATPase [Deltaproteobacteria bacterium]|nr:AAA family ATPase [Deltaproteobacteria bacterium]